MRTKLRIAIAVIATLAMFGGVAWAQEPAPSAPVPDGYLTIQAPADWRDQTSDWYLEQAKSTYQQMTSESGSAPAGVAIVDRDTGDVLAVFDATALTAP